MISGTDRRTCGTSFGNVKQIIEATKSDPERITEITYEPDGIFPIIVTNAAAQKTQVRFDPRWGTPSGIVDPNGIAVLFGHDGFGRVTERHGPDGVTLSTYSTISVPNRVTATGSIDPKIQVQMERRGVEGSVDGATADRIRWLRARRAHDLRGLRWSQGNSGTSLQRSSAR